MQRNTFKEFGIECLFLSAFPKPKTRATVTKVYGMDLTVGLFARK